MKSRRKSNKLLRLPVRFVDGRWEFYFGGEVLVKEGTFAELIVHPIRIADDAFLKRVTKTVDVCIAVPGSTLLVALNNRSGLHFTKGSVVATDTVTVDRNLLPFEAPTFVPVVLKRGDSAIADEPPELAEGGLWLRVTGANEAELVSGPIELPEQFAVKVGDGEQSSTVISLNHAYTVLSERLETHRISHTGNVYLRVFYKESNGRWYPLETLRTKAVNEAELNVMRSAWADLERQLGWTVSPLSGVKHLDRFKKGTPE